MARAYTAIEMLPNTLVDDRGKELFFTVFSNEMTSIIFTFNIANASGGITALNRIEAKFFTSYNNGDDWEELDYNFEPIIGDGYFRAFPKGSTARLGPQCKLVIAPPAGETAEIKVHRTALGINDVYSYNAQSGEAGLLSYRKNSLPKEVEINTLVPDANSPLPIEIYSGQQKGPLVSELTLDTPSVVATDSPVIPSVAIVHGWDESTLTHKELRLTPDARLPAPVLVTNGIALLDFTSTPLLAGQSMAIITAGAEGIDGIEIFCDVGEAFNLEVDGVVVGRVFPGGGRIEFAEPLIDTEVLELRPEVDFSSGSLQANILIRRYI